MKISATRKEAQGKIDSFFHEGNFTAEEAKKIKKLAMKFNIKIGEYRKKFCKKCYSQLKGKLRIRSGNKTIECASCGQLNKFKL